MMMIPQHLFCLLLIGLSFCGPDESFPNEPAATGEITRDSVWIETPHGRIFGIFFRPVTTTTSAIPAVLCLQGGGDVGLSNYLYEARFFAENGIPALVCDKAGAGLSETSISWREQGFDDKIKEYHHLMNWLKSQDGIDSTKMGVHGMSEGGRLALNMAIEYPDEVAFVNSVSGPIESYKDNQLYAIEQHLLALDIDSTSVQQAVDVWALYFDDIANEEIKPATLAAIRRLISDAPAIRYRPNTSGRLPPRPLPRDVHFGLKGKLDEVRCPVFFQYGALDRLVDPRTSLALIPPKANFTIVEYVDTDHSMTLTNGNVHPRFIPDKLSWIKAVLGQDH